jgi:hypothetical protein
LPSVDHDQEYDDDLDALNGDGANAESEQDEYALSFDPTESFPDVFLGQKGCRMDIIWRRGL